MNEGMFIALRGLGQETNSLLRQLLEAQNKTNEMLSQLVKPAAAPVTQGTKTHETKKGK